MRGMRDLGDGRGVLKLDLPRLYTVMQGMARAIYFDQNGSRFTGAWRVLPSLHTEATVRGKSDECQVRRAILEGFQYVDLELTEPKVFRCEQARSMSRSCTASPSMRGSPFLYGPDLPILLGS